MPDPTPESPPLNRRRRWARLVARTLVDREGKALLEFGNRRELLLAWRELDPEQDPQVLLALIRTHLAYRAFQAVEDAVALLASIAGDMRRFARLVDEFERERARMRRAAGEDEDDGDDDDDDGQDRGGDDDDGDRDDGEDDDGDRDDGEAGDGGDDGAGDDPDTDEHAADDGDSDGEEA